VATLRGGSTPRALALYGVTDIRGDSDDMYRLGWGWTS
jgi:hypothetical protein